MQLSRDSNIDAGLDFFAAILVITITSIAARPAYA